MPQENKSLDQITEQIKQSLESQAQVIDSAVSSVVEGIQSDNSKFVDELDIIKGNILGAISVQTQGGKLSGLTIDKAVTKLGYAPHSFAAALQKCFYEEN